MGSRWSSKTAMRCSNRNEKQRTFTRTRMCTRPVTNTETKPSTCMNRKTWRNYKSHTEARSDLDTKTHTHFDTRVWHCTKSSLCAIVLPADSVYDAGTSKRTPNTSVHPSLCHTWWLSEVLFVHVGVRVFSKRRRGGCTWRSTAAGDQRWQMLVSGQNLIVAVILTFQEIILVKQSYFQIFVFCAPLHIFSWSGWVKLVDVPFCTIEM